MSRDRDAWATKTLAAEEDLSWAAWIQGFFILSSTVDDPAERIWVRNYQELYTRDITLIALGDVEVHAVQGEADSRPAPVHAHDAPDAVAPPEGEGHLVRIPIPQLLHRAARAVDVPFPTIRLVRLVERQVL